MGAAEFEKFARSKGHNVVDGVVVFEQDEAAARAFDQEAYKAGFKPVVGVTQAKWTDGKESLSKWPKECWIAKDAPSAEWRRHRFY